jgi:hypothetical protein
MLFDEALDDEALDLDSLAAVAAELSALPQAAKDNMSAADTAIETNFLIVLSLLTTGAVF